MNEMVSISQSRLDELLEKENWLWALEAAGVDNWTGYDMAVTIFEEENEN